MKKSRILLTGGGGLIGSNVAEELNRRGIDDILVVDHLGTSEKWKNLARIRYYDYIEKKSFLDRVEKKGLPESIQAVIHLGACSSTTESDASYLVENNFEYTKILCREALRKKIRFVYASSAATYGDGNFGYSDESELKKLHPLNMYGYSKHMFDLYAQKKGYLKEITGLKYFNVFGFGEFHKGEMMSMVLKGYRQIQSEGKIRLFKSYKKEFSHGGQKRDFLYARDAAKITLHLLNENHPGLYNVGRGVAETWNDLANALFSGMGKKKKIEYIDMPQALRGKYQYYTCATTDKLRATGYKDPFHSLEDAVKEYVSLLESN